MANDLTLIETILLPAASNPARLPSLPVWLQQRSDALGSAVQGDSSTNNHREMTVLPPELILNSLEARLVADHIEGLRDFLRLDMTMTWREQVLTNDQAHGAMIAGLLIKGGGIKLDKASSDALTEDYLDAIEDLPAWSVREALRKWNRGESVRLDGKPHDFNWRPTPPTLRRLAQHELVMIKARILRCEKLLTAVPMVTFSDEHRREMLDKLAALPIAGSVSPPPLRGPMPPAAQDEHLTQEAAE